MAALEVGMREAALFAACGFLLLGLGDVLVDLIWIGLRLKRQGQPSLRLENLPKPGKAGRLAVFIPAWDESAVIGSMLRRALERFGTGDYRLYVGCYPNDPATIAAVRAVGDQRVRLVVGPLHGPTTKGDCLNRLWAALLAEEETEGNRFKAIVLHDAEDSVHSAELRVFDAMIERFDFVQLPVIPIVHPASPWVSGHYADEFAEAHGKEMVVREAIGAGLPSAGVGCAFSRDALERLAAQRGGLPFDADSLTEDYELGLRLKALGGSATFVRMYGGTSRAPVATREYFPQSFMAAVSQKARWITGIALSGWDRLGWQGGVAERWMRLRDRQSLLAAFLLFAGYGAVGLWILLHAAGQRPEPMPPLLDTLVTMNVVLLLWRALWRAAFVTQAYGWREGLKSLPRMIVGNAIAMWAAVQALTRYRELRRTGRAAWDKTAHVFPIEAPAE
jgi:adsorption protein B